MGSKAKTTECCFCRSETAKRKEYAEPSVSEASRQRQTTMRRWRAMKNPTSATKKDSIVDWVSAMEFCFLALKPLILMVFRVFFLL